MLTDIKKLLIERQQMTIVDLARHFHVSESIMLGMLSHWQKKGRIEIIDSSGACGSGCGSCDEGESAKIFFRWKKVAEKPIFAQVSE
jgi:hypothetical protein